MTWTAGELVNELRHVDPDTEVWIVGGRLTLDRVPRRRLFRARRLSRILRVRVIRRDAGRFAYIEGEAL